MQNMRKSAFITLVLLLLMLGTAFPCQAQRVPQPTRAMLYSALFPGGGQLYNRAWVKAGLVMGVQGWLISSAFYNDGKRDDYHSLAANASQASELAYYKAMEREYRDRVNNDIWWIGITAALSMVDAYVDAHLYDFEEQDRKLKLRFSESGLTLQYRF
jgi:hypothetical protein